MKQVKNFLEASGYLLNFAPIRPPKMVGGFIGLERTQYFLNLLGNPQDKIKVVHVAGTSGKGSTAYLSSLLLSSQGFKTGLHMSPHLLDIRERVQINNQLISEEKFTQYLNEILPTIEKMKDSKYGQPTYFELTTVLSFYSFYRENCDYAVMETGMGGLYDATNTVRNSQKLAVITRIGLDHMHLLGNTLSKIASQKAGIIQSKNIVITLDQVSRVNKVFQKRAQEKAALMLTLKKGLHFKNVSLKGEKTTFDFEFENIRTQISLALIGEYQAENCSLALASLVTLGQRDRFQVNWPKVFNILKDAYFVGRFQILNVNDKRIILDGAHNPQKMSSFVSSLDKVIPGKVDFLISFKKGKDYLEMLKIISKKANKIIVTSFALTGNDLKNYKSEETEKIGKVLEEIGFKNYELREDQEGALKEVMNSKSDIILTGSLYFISNIYPKLQKTS